jgi:predicted phosphohydrolase
MANFQIISDLHVEKHGLGIFDSITPQAKTLIIAGDLGHGEEESYIHALQRLSPMYENIVLVPGNHEYISRSGTSMSEILGTIRRATQYCPNLIVLDNSYVTIDGVVIFGSTFWSYCPSQHYPRPNIFLGSQPITSHQHNALHFAALRTLESVLEYASSVDRKLLVVTHHAPTFHGTLHPKYPLDDPKNYMYCSSNDAILANERIVAWAYGHTGYNGCVGKLVTNQVEHGGSFDRGLLKIPL